MSRKSFTPEIKQERVELVIRQGYQVKQVAIAMDARTGISSKTAKK
ncbi:hypothetical protein OPS25_01405 [Alteromonas ponticola]|uniref:Transposase n=1 Tax=Alteromonas aquimaris TaxID=2998417 RepID=A0ABT3P330_9ALTE|nr:hypothetical protein [Alteromonas aquimaris]MCW8107159.1 hypothetical protein [Alteromonas aquimaris]